MAMYAPDYYSEFKCINKYCKHNCCIGWEIDIDDETYEKYKSQKGDFGDRLKKSISDGVQPHFTLKDNDRCPFLNDENLCDIIINMGEDSLCQICSDHPRFRNFFPEREEIGLGLCCEAAADLIINRTKKFKLLPLNAEENDDDFFTTRQNIFEIITDRNIKISERIEKLISEFDIKLSSKSLRQWADIYLGLERLDTAWDFQLNILKNSNYQITHLPDNIELPLEQLLAYFIFRHLSEGYYDGNVKGRISFAVLSTSVIANIYKGSDLSLEEVARMYSAEIEYSDENTQFLIDLQT